jgi:hypothetical protein
MVDGVLEGALDRDGARLTDGVCDGLELVDGASDKEGADDGYWLLCFFFLEPPLPEDDPPPLPLLQPLFFLFPFPPLLSPPFPGAVVVGLQEGMVDGALDGALDRDGARLTEGVCEGLELVEGARDMDGAGEGNDDFWPFFLSRPPLPLLQPLFILLFSPPFPPLPSWWGWQEDGMVEGNSEGSPLGAVDTDGMRLTEGTEDGTLLMDGVNEMDGVSLGVIMDGTSDGHADLDIFLFFGMFLLLLLLLLLEDDTVGTG